MQSLVDQSPDVNIPTWQKVVIFSMIATAFLTLWASLYVPINDGDIWFHLLYGKAILANHTLAPDHTIYSWTPSSNDTIYCAWLGQVIYYLLYNCFGNVGVIVLRYLAATTLFIAILLLSRQRSTFYNPITWFTALLCTLIISQVALDKPEILTFTFMALIVWNWYKIKQIKQHVLYQIYLFPLLILVWVNTHGGFIYGCLFLLCVGLGETINQILYQQNALPRKIYYHLLLALFLSAGCTLITPYGYDYIYQLVMQNFDKQLQVDISKVDAYFTTFEVLNNPQLTVFADTAIAIILLVFGISLYKRQLDFVPIISNLVFAFLFTRYARSMLPWIAVFSLSIVYYCSAVCFIQTRRKVLFFAIVSMSTYVLSGWFWHHERQFPTRGSLFEFGIGEQFTIDEEIVFIKKNYPNTILGNTYDHGAYILWNNWPQTKVMMDARYFPYKNWFKECLAFYEAVNVETFIQKYPFDVIAVKHNHSALILWFHKSKDWKLVFYGKSAAIFVRKSLITPVEITRGQNLSDIKELSTAVQVIHTSILIRDWPGADIILKTIKEKFLNKSQQNVISGISDIKNAAQMFDKNNFSASIRYMEMAFEKQIFDNSLYAAALMMKGIENWQDKQWAEAIKNTTKSLQIETSFAAIYNLVLMGWQMETMGQNKQIYLSSLADKEKEIVTNWKEMLSLLVQNKIKFQKQYAPFIENANKILKGDKDCSTQFVAPNY